MNMNEVNEVGKSLKEAGVTGEQMRVISPVISRLAEFPLTAATFAATYKVLVPESSRAVMVRAGRSRTLREALVRGEGVHVHPEVLTPPERRGLVAVLQQEAKKQQLTLRTATYGGRFYYGLWDECDAPPPCRGKSAGTSPPGWVLDVNHPSGL